MTAVLTCEDKIFGPPREALRTPEFLETKRRSRPAGARQKLPHYPLVWITSAAEVRFARRLFCKGRRLLSRLSLAFRKCHPLIIPARLMLRVWNANGSVALSLPQDAGCRSAHARSPPRRCSDQRHPVAVVPLVNQKYLGSVPQTIRKLVPALPTLRLDDSKMGGVAEPSAPPLLQLILLQLVPLAVSGCSALPSPGAAQRQRVALRSSMGQRSGHIVRVARLIKANVPHHVTRVPEVDEHEPAFCHFPQYG